MGEVELCEFCGFRLWVIARGTLSGWWNFWPLDFGAYPSDGCESLGPYLLPYLVCGYWVIVTDLLEISSFGDVLWLTLHNADILSSSFLDRTGVRANLQAYRLIFSPIQSKIGGRG